MSGYDEYFFGLDYEAPPPDLKAEARERLETAAAYARLHAPELFAEWVREQARKVQAPRSAPKRACWSECILGTGHSGECYDGY